LRWRTSNCSSLLIYRPRKDERLSWPSWLIFSGRFTHIVVTSPLKVERRTVSVRRPKTVDLYAVKKCNGISILSIEMNVWQLNLSCILWFLFHFMRTRLQQDRPKLSEVLRAMTYLKYRVAQKSKLLYCVNSLLFLSHPVKCYLIFEWRLCNLS